jgi:hypothetical protein
LKRVVNISRIGFRRAVIFEGQEEKKNLVFGGRGVIPEKYSHHPDHHHRLYRQHLFFIGTVKSWHKSNSFLKRRLLIGKAGGRGDV